MGQFCCVTHCLCVAACMNKSIKQNNVHEFEFEFICTKIRKLKVLINQLPANKIRAYKQTQEIHRIEFVNREKSVCCWRWFFVVVSGCKDNANGHFNV